MDTSTAVTVFAALSQKTRLSVLRLLVEAGPAGLAAGTLSDRFQMAHNSMSFHLAQLKAAGLIHSHKQGRSIFYQANFARINQLIEFLLEDCCIDSNGSCEPSAAGQSVSALAATEDKPRLRFNWSQN